MRTGDIVDRTHALIAGGFRLTAGLARAVDSFPQSPGLRSSTKRPNAWARPAGPSNPNGTLHDSLHRPTILDSARAAPLPRHGPPRPPHQDRTKGASTGTRQAAEGTKIVFTIAVSPDNPTWRAAFAAAWIYAAMQPHDPAEPRGR
jgi:hypothetical protein